MYSMKVPRQGEEVQSFSWKGSILDDLEALFSSERLSKYIKAAQGDREKAFHLYTWNTAMSAAFYGPLQGLEVALRNAMHRQLTECYGADWYDNPAAGLDMGCLLRIAKAKTEVARVGHEPGSPPRIVAALSFGFWVSLLGPGGRVDPAGRRANYEMTLWRAALRRAFSHCTPMTRKQAHRPLNRLRKLRNRIAHHEPIFARDLLEDHQRILDVTGWISPGARTWIEGHSRVAVLLDASHYATDVHF